MRRDDIEVRHVRVGNKNARSRREAVRISDVGTFATLYVLELEGLETLPHGSA